MVLIGRSLSNLVRWNVIRGKNV